MGKSPTDGLLLVDKPGGITSFQVVARVRRRYGVRQVGHAGTLDPLASGLLPVLVGEATKLTPWTMGLDKVYRATLRLGTATDSYDADGRVTQVADPSAVAAVDEGRLRAALAPFHGVVRQRPPAFSAIRKDGQRLYDLARRTAARGGDVEAIEVEEREVTLFSITLAAFALPDATLTIHCGKGTYVRSIVHDLGQALGCHAHLTALRRLRIGPFLVDDALAIDGPGGAADEPPALLPLAQVVAHLPTVILSAAAERRVRMGQQAVLDDLALPTPGRAGGGGGALDTAGATAGAVRLLAEGGYLVAIAVPAEPAPADPSSAPDRTAPTSTPPRLRLARVFAPPSVG